MTHKERKDLSASLKLIDTKNPKETMKDFIKDIEKKLGGSKVIYISETGSVLHGTNSNNSDSDYKGIYLPSVDSLVLDNYHSVINIKTNEEDTKNGSDDIDMEIYSLFTFFEKASTMESNNIEILFSMFSDKIMLETDESHIIRDNKDLFLSSNVEKFIGFAMSMAYRYSEKGDRLREVEELLNFFKEKTIGMSKQKLKKTPISDMEGLPEFVEDKEYLAIVEGEGYDKKIEKYLQVLSAKYIIGSNIGYVYKGIEGKLNGFGKRAQKAKEAEGIDTKAFAHALRAILQSKELLTTKRIVFPLTYSKLLKEMKYGKDLDRKELSDIIEREHEELVTLKDSIENTLTSSVDYDKLNKLKLEVYHRYMKRGK